MKRIGIYIIIFILILLFRDNICFFYGNVLGVFKLDNNYYDAIVTLKDNELDYLSKEYESLSEFSKHLYKIPYDYKVSKIIYKESYNIGKYKIQYGKKDRVEEGLGIVNEFGFVGKITNVGDKTSELTTIKDLKDISVIINDVHGKMNYDYETNKFVITDISNYDKVYVNDEVYTSGYGTVKEKLYIGKVKSIENETISKKVYIESEVDFNDLNYVLIVGDFT